MQRIPQKPNLTETDEQIMIIEWARVMERQYPDLALLYHVPNGGKRNAAEAARFKQQGVKAGVPDLCLPVPCGTYHGLYIELKAEGGKPSGNQLLWLEKLRQQGFCAVLCYGAKAAISTIEHYMREGSQDG